MPIPVFQDAASPVTVAGPLVSLNDAVPIKLAGSAYATAAFSVSGTAGTAKATAEYTTDLQGINAVNWNPAPYAKRTDTLSANPTVKAIADVALTTGEAWEVPLPGNCTAFRVRCSTAGTSTTVQVQGSAHYVPGVPVVATLYDVTEGSIGAGLSSIATALDVSGWNTFGALGVSPTTQSVLVRELDDAGAGISGFAFTYPVTATAYVVFMRAGGSTSAAAIAAANATAITLNAKRVAAYLPTGGTVSTGRIRIVASR